MFFKSGIWINGAVQSGEEKPLNGYYCSISVFEKGTSKKDGEGQILWTWRKSWPGNIYEDKRDKVEVWDSQYHCGCSWPKNYYLLISSSVR